MVPIPEADSFETLNKLLLERCLQDDTRRVSRQAMTIGQANKALVQRFFDEVCNARKLDVADELRAGKIWGDVPGMPGS